MVCIAPGQHKGWVMDMKYYLVSKMMDTTVLIVSGSAGPPKADLKSRPMPCKPGPMSLYVTR